ncbi:MAG: M1 family aminopeptidase [Ginsengibacter sp.]
MKRIYLALLLISLINISFGQKTNETKVITFGNQIFLESPQSSDIAFQQNKINNANDILSPDRVARNKMIEHEMAAYQLRFGSTVPTTGTEYDVKYYRLELRINPDTSVGKYIAGAVTTYFTTTVSNFSSVNFDFASPLTCDSVYYHGSKLSASNITRPVDLLQVAIPNLPTIGTLDSLTVYYRGVPPVVPYFGNGTGYVNTTHNGSQNYVYTLSEPYSSYTWWPCKSYVVNDKADSMDMIVSTPTSFKTAGNGKLISETIVGPNKITYWQERYPISSYQVCTAVANYVQYPAVADTVLIGSTKMPVFNYLFPETNTLSSRTSLDRVKLMLTTFSNKFGDYPFKNEKYGNYSFGFGGGMEHNTFSGESANGVYDQSYYWDILAHELGHQWFGASVTCGSWGDIWINESFATFSESICAEFAPSVSAAAGQTGVSWRAYHKSQAINPGNQYQSVYVNDTSNMATIFTPAVFVYERGAMVLYMLRTLLGDTKFFQAIQNYTSDPLLKYGNAVTADVKRHMEAVSGLDLSTFFNQWIYNTGFAKYNGAQWNDVGNAVILSLPQTVQSSALTHFDMPVPVRIQGSNSVTMDTTIIVYDKGGILYYDVDGVLGSSGSNMVQYNLSFKPVTITFDAYSQVLASGSFTKNSGLTLLANNLVSFSGKKIADNTVKLIWTLDNTKDYYSFEIEKSINGADFKKIGNVNTADFVNTNNFSFIDANASGVAYYRIKLLSKTDNFTYSNIVSFSVKEADNLYTISPNPANDFININTTQTAQKVNIKIYDAAGQQVKKLSNQSFINGNIRIDVHNYKTGSYFIEIQSLNFKTIKQVIIQ